MNKFDELIKLKRGSGYLYAQDHARAFLAPDLGARVFVELDGLLQHRLDLENVKNPNKPFNNYGGNSFWPAPEGGRYGFNYKGDTWYVQPAINNEPFLLQSQCPTGATVFKKTVLENRNGIKLDVLMTRKFSVSNPSPVLHNLLPSKSFSYEVEDHIEVLNTVSSQDSLLACWTLEQFEANEFTHSFIKVPNPPYSINFDFYEDPRNKITYGSRGVFYKTDSKQRGQIGIKKEARPEYIGFYDLRRKLLCMREVLGDVSGIYFNIADNEQTQGPFSAADMYSIFNGQEDMGFFELETIAGADIQNEKLKGSRLISRTSFALFDSTEPIEWFLSKLKQPGKQAIKSIQSRKKTTPVYDYLERE
jgi:hypothetical protein